MSALWLALEEKVSFPWPLSLSSTTSQIGKSHPGAKVGRGHTAPARGSTQMGLSDQCPGKFLLPTSPRKAAACAYP